MFLPDTNACSHFMRGHNALVPQWLAHASLLHLSTVVIAELEHGAAKGGSARQRTRLNEFIALLPAEPFTVADAAEYGLLRARLERRGELIGPFDLLIAAQALRLGATIVTHNLREFQRVPGLKVVDWQEP